MVNPDPFDFGTDTQPGGPPSPPARGRRPWRSARPTSHRAKGDAAAAAGAAPARIPLRWLGLGIVTSVVAAVVALLYGTAVPVAFLCWALAGPVAIGLLGVHVLRATSVRAGPATYTESGATVPLYWTALAVAAIGIGLSAWQIADWAGRL